MLPLSMFGTNGNLEAPNMHTRVYIHNRQNSPRGRANPQGGLIQYLFKDVWAIMRLPFKNFKPMKGYYSNAYDKDWKLPGHSLSLWNFYW